MPNGMSVSITADIHIEAICQEKAETVTPKVRDAFNGARLLGDPKCYPWSMYVLEGLIR